jgi:hypothetical protein
MYTIKRSLKMFHLFVHFNPKHKMINMKRNSSSFIEKIAFVYLLFFLLYSCRNPQRPEQELNTQSASTGNEILQIDPRTFTQTDFLLSEIADDINYIPLDNGIPLGAIGSLKFINNSIYLSVNGMHLLKFDRTGKKPMPIGKEGRGPGEYFFCASYTVDPKTENIYILGKKDALMVYSPLGKFIREFQLPQCTDGSLFHSIEFINSDIFLAQYVALGRSQYNWMIIDTTGNMISKKPNFLPPFESRTGQFGGVNKFKDRINYWDIYNDTVFTISQDNSFKPAAIFPPGNYRRRQEDIKVSSPKQYMDEVSKICMTLNLIETENFWVYKYRFNLYGVAFIDKRSKITKASLHPTETWGINNDIDMGPVFLPEAYLYENGNEYIVGIVPSYKIIEHSASATFKASTPKDPDKKKQLEKMANSLEETDNPVLILVKLKK